MSFKQEFTFLVSVVLCLISMDIILELIGIQKKINGRVYFERTTWILSLNVFKWNISFDDFTYLWPNCIIAKNNLDSVIVELYRGIACKHRQNITIDWRTGFILFFSKVTFNATWKIRGFVILNLSSPVVRLANTVNEWARANYSWFWCT